MKENNYFTIQGWMRTELNLTGNDLLVYAIIYGFSQTEDQKYTAGLQYLADWCGATKQGIQKNLKNLLEKNLIIKEEVVVNNVKLSYYRAVGYTTELYTMQLSCINNNIINNTNSNNTNKLEISSNTENPKKKNLYEKSVDVIKDFTDNEELIEALIEWLNLQLEIYREKGRVFYVNVLKSKLKNLRANFNESEWLRVVKCSTSHGWQDFYDSYTISANSGVVSLGYTNKELDDLAELAKERERNGKRTKF